MGILTIIQGIRDKAFTGRNTSGKVGAKVSAWLPWYCLSLFFTEVLGKEVAANIINLYLVLALGYQDASDI